MRWFAGLALFSSCLVAVAWPSSVSACGGTFCDGGPPPQDPQPPPNPAPQSMPVEQTGETIVFSIDEDSVEAHIQIEYDPTTEASKFAWIIPVTALPEFSVGSQRLFGALLSGTAPGHGFETQLGPCCVSNDDDGDSGDDDDDDDDADDDDETGGDDGGTQVLLEETVGAFDAVVLQSSSAEELMLWLRQNGYSEDPAATPIFQQYVDGGFLFIALRLTPGAGIGSIHPIVIEYPGNEPCIPIRLTSIAAKQNMAIRAFFFASERYAPTNYRHVELNPLAIDWLGLGDNYNGVLTRAVDEPSADGHAFATEFAGPTAALPRGGIHSAMWHPEAFESAEPTEVIDILRSQGLIDCDGFECTYGHALIRGLLLEFLPPPADVSEGDFWSDVSAYADRVDQAAWSGPGFAAAMTERVIDPGLHALDLFERHPYLTRLATTISPHEMTVDPLFHANADLDDVDRRIQFAQYYDPCMGPGEMSGIDDFAPVRVGGIWPFREDQMPAALRIESIPPAGAPMVLVDNHDRAKVLLSAWNADLPEDAACGNGDETALGCGCLASPRGGAGGSAGFAALVLAVVAALRRRG